jgi:pentatricopeptide repeat protein
MKEAKIELTSMTFNTLIEACARSNEMDRLSSIVEDMTAHGVDLDQVSYNTIIKGLCHEKQLDQALELREKMRRGGKHAVDAHAYGALLDGCSRLGKFQLGFDLLEAMLQEGVVPNNITLSSLVRLAGYSHQPWALERALSVCDELSRKHSIRLNWHVYKNLSKACIAHGDLQRALGFLAQAVKAGLKCDEDAYVAIILALATEKKTLMDAVSVLRLAAGLCVTCENLPTALVDIPAQNLRAHGGMSVQCVATVLLAIAALDQALAVTLVVELEREAGLHFDRQTKLRLTSSKVTAMHF